MRPATDPGSAIPRLPKRSRIAERLPDSPFAANAARAASGIRNGRRTESDRRLRQNRRLRPRAYGRSHAVHRQTDRRASTTEKRDRHRTARIDRKRVSTDANSSQAIAAFGTWLFIGGWATVLSPKERPIPECGSSIWKNFPGRKTFRRAKSRNYEKRKTTDRLPVVFRSYISRASLRKQATYFFGHLFCIRIDREDSRRLQVM